MTGIEQMRSAGATVDMLSAEDLAERDVVLSGLTDFDSNSRYEFRQDLTAYLMRWPSSMDGHLRSFDEVDESLLYEVRNIGTFDFYGQIGRAIENTDDMSDEAVAFREAYQRNLEERPGIVRGGLLRILNNQNNDANAQGEPYGALLYPSVLGLAPVLGDSPSTGSNNRLSPFSGFPALTMPAGMVMDPDPDPAVEDEPALAMSVGMELLAREFDEPTLIRLAYGYEQVARPRQAPTFTPEIDASTD